MKLIRNPELKGILGILLIVLALGTLLAGLSGKLEQWGLPWFTGSKVFDKIFFVSDASGTKEIYSMNIDGSDRKQITHGARVLSVPAIIPTANRITFVGMCGSVSQVMAIGVDGGTPRALTSSTGSKRQPQYSPDGKKLSYIETGRVYVAEINGSNPNPVMPTSEEMSMAMSNAENRSTIPLYTSYSWAPDSEGMAAISSPDRITDSLKYLPTANGKIMLVMPTAPTVRVIGTAWAAKKSIMAATVLYGHEDLVIVFYPDEKRVDAVLHVKDTELGTPSVSPDGSVIIAQIKAVPEKKYPALLKIDVETKKSTVLCRGMFIKPVFSPDGKKILAAQYDNKSRKHNIVTIEVKSGKVTQLTHGDDCFDAVFSPQSEH